MKNLFVILSFTVLLFVNNTFAQEVKLEKKLEQEESFGTFHSMESGHLLEIKDSEEKNEFRLNVYDENLVLEEGFDFETKIKFYHFRTKYNAMLGNEKGNKAVISFFNDKNKILLLFVDVEERSLETVEIPKSFKMISHKLMYIDDEAYIIGQSKKRGVYMLKVDRNRKVSNQWLSHVNPKKLNKSKLWRIDNLSYNLNDSSFYMAQNQYNKKKRGYNTEIIQFDSDGSVINRGMLEPNADADHYFYGLNFTPNAEGGVFITGTFGNKKINAAALKRSTGLLPTKGFFVTAWVDNDFTMHNEILTNDLDSNLYYYFKSIVNKRSEKFAEKSVARLERKRARKEKKGKEFEHEISARVQAMEVVNGKIVMCIEYFEPYVVTYTTTNSNGTTTTTRKVVGYNHLSGGLVILDPETSEVIGETGYKLPYYGYSWNFPRITELNIENENEIHLNFSGYFFVNYLVYNEFGEKVKFTTTALKTEDFDTSASKLKSFGLFKIYHWYDTYYYLSIPAKIKGENKRKTNFLMKYDFSGTVE